MQQFIIALEFILFAYVGALGHYLKKRYIDDTTKDSLNYYLTVNRTATKQAMWTIAGSAIGLSLLHTNGYWLGLQELIGVLAAGYAVDSWLNKSSESAAIKETVKRCSH